MAIRHKYGAIRTEYEGVSYPSKLEAKYAQKLDLCKKSGDLLFYLRQSPLHLPGGVRYVIDFIEFWRDGEVKFTDCKGFETKEFLIKKKIAEEVYHPLKINVVTKV